MTQFGSSHNRQCFPPRPFKLAARLTDTSRNAGRAFTPTQTTFAFQSVRVNWNIYVVSWGAPTARKRQLAINKPNRNKYNFPVANARYTLSTST